MIAFPFVYTLQPQLHKLYLFIFALDYFIFNLLYTFRYIFYLLYCLTRYRGHERRWFFHWSIWPTS